MSRETQEDATNLQFNDDMDRPDCVPLFLADVQRLLEERVKQNPEIAEDPNSSMQKTLDYAKRLGQYDSEQSVNQIRMVLADKGLHKFEEAQLVNLAPETPEEAIALIPSLDRIEEHVLADLLEELQSYRSFHGLSS